MTFLVLSMVTGSAAAIAVALLLFLGVFEASVLADAVSVWSVPLAAAGLFAVAELAFWSAALAGRGSGWSTITVFDGARLVIVTVAVGGVAALVLGLSTGLPVSHGILVQAMGVAAAAAAVAILWALARERTG